MNSSSLPKGFALFLLASMLFLMSACGPQSKASYLEKYEAFIEDIQAQHHAYSAEDWAEKDEKYKQFSSEWYDKFSDEFTFLEELRVAKLGLTYHMLQVKTGASGLIQELLEEENLEELKEQIRFYVDHEMEDDIEEIVREAERAGDEAADAVKKILDELEVEIQVNSHETE